MLDILVPILAALALICGALTGRLESVGTAVTESARLAVEVALGLLASMTLWLGLLRVVEAGGLLQILTRGVRPLARRLFPDVPADHPAMDLVILSFASNMAGLENAATPVGIKAMKELERLNTRPGVATDAMVLFVTINTANVMLFPGPIVALRAALGSASPGSIVLPTLLATVISTGAAIVLANWLAPWFPVRDAVASAGGAPPMPAAEAEANANANANANAGRAPEALTPTAVRRGLAIVLGAAAAAALGIAFWARAHGLFGVGGGWRVALRAASSDWLLPLIVTAILLWGLARGVAVFERAVEGGREAFDVVLRIFPYLVVILLATGMLRASGAFDLLLRGVGPLAALLHIPPEAIPMGLMRSLSGSGARGFAVEIMRMHGPDSFVGQVVSVIQGSTETTFYVMAVYFGAVRVRVARHALLACLLADAVGVLASVWACRLLL